MTKASHLKFLNPFTWIGMALSLMRSLFSALARAFGLTPPPDTTGLERIERSDVEDAARLAREKQNALDELTRTIAPQDVVHAYCRAHADERPAIDLGALTPVDQDWLLRLDDVELILLAQAGPDICRIALEQKMVKPLFWRVQKQASPQPSSSSSLDVGHDDEWKRRYIARQFREVVAQKRNAPPDRPTLAAFIECGARLPPKIDLVPSMMRAS